VSVRVRPTGAPDRTRPPRSPTRKGESPHSHSGWTGRAARPLTNLKTSGKILGIELLGHIIFNQQDHYSSLENGDL